MSIAPIEIAPSSEPSQTKTVRVPHQGRKQLVFKLTDADGKALKLDEEVENPPADLPDYFPQKSATGANVSIRLKSSQGDITGPSMFDIEGDILDQEKYRGFVVFQLDREETKHPGIHEASIGRFVSDEYLTDTWRVLIIIEPSAFSQLHGVGPLTIPEIRLALLDLETTTGGAPFSNLLDDVEFQEVEIVHAMRRVVDKWNETPPPVNRHTPASFPYRYWWLQGTCAHLLLMGAARYRRNRLDYQAGGVAINDQSKANEYEQVGRLKMQEFDQWMMHEKTRINMDRLWATGI